MEPTRYIARGGDVRETIRLGATLVDWRHIAVLRIAPAWLSGYAVVILLVTVLVNLATQLARTAYGLTLPAMRDSLGLSYSQAGSLIAAVSIFLMIASLTFGMLAPRYGSRYIVGASTIAAGVAMVFLGASPSFPIALLTSAAIGFAAGGATTPAMGLLSVWFDARHRGTVAGVAAAGGGMSFIVIGALVPWLTGRDPEDGWRHTWYALAAVVIVTGIFSLVYLRDAPKEVVGAREGGGCLAYSSLPEPSGLANSAPGLLLWMGCPVCTLPSLAHTWRNRASGWPRAAVFGGSLGYWLSEAECCGVPCRTVLDAPWDFCSLSPPSGRGVCYSGSPQSWPASRRPCCWLASASGQPIPSVPRRRETMWHQGIPRRPSGSWAWELGLDRQLDP